MNTKSGVVDYRVLAIRIKQWGRELGFQDIRITDTRLDQAEKYLARWLGLKRHGAMTYMVKHGKRRTRPAELVPGTLRVIAARMDYLPEKHSAAESALARSQVGYISRYALGRDYHRLLRKRLQRLATRIEQDIGPFGYRAFVDSAPVMEKALAEKGGIGWIGKHTNVINRKVGSWFFLGELYTDLPLPVDTQATNHCGSCHACMDICPTQAIVGPYELDARRCISYLTIELRSTIPESLRSLIGNRIFGCDDCQLVCPWNRFAKVSSQPDFAPRPSLKDRDLVDLSNWSEQEFFNNTEGSAIRRIGYECWLRNIAVALGNAKTAPDVVSALERLAKSSSKLVCEHAVWGLQQHGTR
ncbi:MAG: tRNA epoxyqueuosine(34) reductase QueG [Arenicellales bacterium]|nr:tRNA epoxyqueuosine(34) reductase QueG [Arenicellales bacterium]